MISIFISLSIVLIIVIAIMFHQNKELKLESIEKESLIDSLKYNNIELRKEIQRLQIENEKKVDKSTK